MQVSSAQAAKEEVAYEVVNSAIGTMGRYLGLDWRLSAAM